MVINWNDVSFFQWIWLCWALQKWPNSRYIFNWTRNYCLSSYNFATKASSPSLPLSLALPLFVCLLFPHLYCKLNCPIGSLQFFPIIRQAIQEGVSYWKDSINFRFRPNKIKILVASLNRLERILSILSHYQLSTIFFY